MALDGVIQHVEDHPDGLALLLAPRAAEHTWSVEADAILAGHDSIPGQTKLIIESPTWRPHVGDQVWGGAGRVTIESGGISFPYVRKGYTRLQQSW